MPRLEYAERGISAHFLQTIFRFSSSYKNWNKFCWSNRLRTAPSSVDPPSGQWLLLLTKLQTRVWHIEWWAHNSQWKGGRVYVCISHDMWYVALGIRLCFHTSTLCQQSIHMSQLVNSLSGEMCRGRVKRCDTVILKCDVVMCYLKCNVVIMCLTKCNIVIMCDIKCDMAVICHLKCNLIMSHITNVLLVSIPVIPCFIWNDCSSCNAYIPVDYIKQKRTDYLAVLITWIRPAMILIWFVLTYFRIFPCIRHTFDKAHLSIAATTCVKHYFEFW